MALFLRAVVLASLVSFGLGQATIKLQGDGSSCVFDEGGASPLTLTAQFLADLRSDITTLTSNLQTAQGTITTLTTNLATANNDIGTANTNIATAQGTITTLTSGLATANSNIATANTNIAALSSSGTPSGVVAYFAKSTPPSGWVSCNGASVPRTGAYAPLFAVIGVTYGTLSGSTFRVPDLRGQFVRSWSENAGTYDNPRTFGAHQDATEISRTIFNGPVLRDTNPDSTRLGSTIAVNYAGGAVISVFTKENYFTTRPQNVALLACIKL